uniref:Conserved hypothetical plastid protein n=1 Tax=Membranoptera platyphylla TaxID=1204437 RepID=A0A1I9KQP2_9FLOR|nr:conserved hypothetical plastid protein [Membranoptera platyphylla]AMJ16941.1 conserved hypothetical plastid protein [Membranoptera platyphylla]
MLIADDLNRLLEILPDFIKESLEKHDHRQYLIEVVMDLGRRPEARFPHGPEYLSKIIISWNDLDFCIKKLGHFSGDNRSGIESTLHRISSIKNRNGNIIGLTFRVGRAIFGTISIMRDLLETGQSILLLGRPGVGKTTAIREIARVLADEMKKRVVIIDTSNEIAGDGDIPHPAIGRARRMQVVRPEFQHQVMIEAVENHMPEVIIIDEIGTELEALAARTIAERGVQLVGTAHGNYLESVIKNPILADLIGGIQYVTLGDDEAKRRGSQKSILERKTIPAFQIAIEIHERNNLIVHEKVDQVVDQILEGSILYIQRRTFNNDGSVSILCENFNSTEFVAHNNKNHLNLNFKSKGKKLLESIKDSNLSSNSYKMIGYTNNTSLNRKLYNNFHIQNKVIQLYSYGINIQQIESIISTLNFSIALTRDIMKADFILALRNYVKHNSKIRQIAKSKQITIYTIHSSTINNIARALKQMLNLYKIFYIDWDQLCLNKNSIEIKVLLEARIAIEKLVLMKKQSVQLLPQVYHLRKLQSELISLYNLNCISSGKEALQYLRIYPV